MKSKLLLPAMMCLLFLASACEKEDKYTQEELPVTFISSVVIEQSDPISRAIDNSWSVNDMIGVFMKETQKEFPEVNIPNDFYNIPYITLAGNGHFTPALDESGIYYSQKKNVDFIAYYPYRSSIDKYLYNISLLDQSSQENIDFLYSDNAKNQNKTSDQVELSFSHQLSKLRLNIILEEEAELPGLIVKISGCKTQGIFNLATGELTINEEEEDELIETYITVTESSIICEAILFPGTEADNLSVHIQIDEREFNPTPLPEITFEPGKRYTYDVQLKNKKDNPDNENLEIIL